MDVLNGMLWGLLRYLTFGWLVWLDLIPLGGEASVLGTLWKGQSFQSVPRTFCSPLSCPPPPPFFFKETLTPFQRETLNDDFLWLVHTESMAQAGREKQRLFKGVKNRWFMNCISMREVTSFESYSCDSLEMWSQNSQVLPPTVPVLSPCNPALSSFP